MANPLWAPWRMEYIVGPKDHGACIFCGVAESSAAERRARLVVASTPKAFVLLNRYPFVAGHLLVVPHVHVGSIEALDAEDNAALFALTRESVARLRRAVKAEGFNIGMNVGTCAGAGIAEHAHVHVVPRWSGDTNFMPVASDTRVMPQA